MSRPTTAPLRSPSPVKEKLTPSSSGYSRNTTMIRRPGPPGRRARGARRAAHAGGRARQGAPASVPAAGRAPARPERPGGPTVTNFRSTRISSSCRRRPTAHRVVHGRRPAQQLLRQPPHQVLGLGGQGDMQGRLAGLDLGHDRGDGRSAVRRSIVVSEAIAPASARTRVKRFGRGQRPTRSAARLGSFVHLATP